MSDTQYRVALIGVLGRIAAALEATRPEEDQTITLTLDQFSGFDWSGIDAKVLARDADGVSTVWHAGKVYRRRSNDKFGTEIWFSCGDGKNEDGTPKYRRLVEFKEFKPAEPLGRKTEAAMKAATPPAPLPPPGPELPTSILSQPATMGVTSWDIASPADVAAGRAELAAAVAEYQAMGKIVAPQYQPDPADKPADTQRKAKSLREMIDATRRTAPTEEERQRYILLNREYADLLSAVVFHKLSAPVETNLTNNETCGTIAAKIAVLKPIVDAAKAKDAQDSAAANASAEAAAHKAAAERPLAPERLKELLVRKADGKPHNAKASPSHRAAIAGSLEGILGSSLDRHAVQLFLAGRASIGDMPENVLLALFDWLKPAYDGAAKRFVADAMAEREVRLVLEHVRSVATASAATAVAK